MGTFDAVMIAEGVYEAGLQEQLEAWAELVRTGMCWKLQGYFGRSAHALIQEGLITEDGEVTEFAREYLEERNAEDHD